MRFDIAQYDLPRCRIEAAIDQWIFRDRDRMLLKRRLLDGLTYERLAEEFDLSVQQVKTIVYRSVDRLEKKL